MIPFRTVSFARRSICLELLGREVRVVRDVQPGHVRGLVGPRLPDVVPEDLPRGPVDDVRGRVVPLQAPPPVLVYRARDELALLGLHLALDLVDDDVAELVRADDLHVLHRASVALLAAALGVEVGLVQHDQVAHDREDLRPELVLVGVLVEQQLGRGQVLRQLDRRRVLCSSFDFECLAATCM